MKNYSNGFLHRPVERHDIRISNGIHVIWRYENQKILFCYLPSKSFVSNLSTMCILVSWRVSDLDPHWYEGYSVWCFFFIFFYAVFHFLRQESSCCKGFRQFFQLAPEMWLTVSLGCLGTSSVGRGRSWCSNTSVSHFQKPSNLDEFDHKQQADE